MKSIIYPFLIRGFPTFGVKDNNFELIISRLQTLTIALNPLILKKLAEPA